MKFIKYDLIIVAFFLTIAVIAIYAVYNIDSINDVGFKKNQVENVEHTSSSLINGVEYCDTVPKGLDILTNKNNTVGYNISDSVVYATTANVTILAVEIIFIESISCGVDIICGDILSGDLYYARCY